MPQRAGEPTRVIPGLFSKEEQDAALALQDAGFPHPTIDDDAWVLVSARWGRYRAFWGMGPGSIAASSRRRRGRPARSPRRSTA